MALITINRNPSERELRWFGVVVLAFFGLVGTLLLWGGFGREVAGGLWSLGVAAALLYYGVVPLRRPMYLAWMHAFYPIGWIVSNLLLAVIFYGVLTPIGLTLRLFGHDPMRRKLDRAAPSYWWRRNPAGNTARYFRQS